LSKSRIGKEEKKGQSKEGNPFFSRRLHKNINHESTKFEKHENEIDDY
jgi:hypothetical protein